MTEDNKESSGRRKGGIARAAALSDERKIEIAQRAALARWGARATHKGNFLKDFGIDIECYVLDDPAKTAVISQRGMGQAIGFSRRGSRLTVFVNSKTMDDYIGRDLREKIENPLIFQLPGAAAASPVSARANGYDATMLIDICNAILAAKADGKLSGGRYERMIEQARIITSASAKNGIRQLVYALAGYNPTAEEVISAFKLYVREEAREYEKEFPDQLYAEWYRLYKLPKPPKNKPWKFKHLTIEHVYEPLAKSSGKIYQLTQALRAASNERWKKLHQFLSDVGVKALRMQLGQTLGIAQISDTAEQYEANIQRAFGAQQDLFRR
ncbi:MAG TPA: P63C domain-containing protein [Alphaproteobacteria bacterium]|nr:P63C domain-containing protein [Alphaproteobacteria bacterium]